MAHPAPEISKVPPPLSGPRPGYKEGPRDWQNVFAIWRFRFIEALFHLSFEIYENISRTLLYRGLLYGDSSVIIRVFNLYLGVESFFVNYCLLSLSKKPTFCEITTGFPAKRRLKKRAWKFHTVDASLLIG